MKYLDESGLSSLVKKLLGYIPKKTSDLTNDSDFLQRCIVSKTYQNIIATANSQAAGTFYYAKIIPDDYYLPCRVKVRYIAKINENMTHTDRDKYRGLYATELVITGESVTRYENYNAIYSASYKPIYYHSLYRTSKAGQDKGCPHYLGTSLYSANAPTTATLKRDFKIELIETENCTVEFLDEMVLQSAFYNSTDYIGISNYNAYSNGNFHTGDANSIDRLCYGSLQAKAADVSIFGTQLILSADGENFHSIVNQRSTSLTASTKKVNQYAFRPNHIFYYSNVSTVTVGDKTTTSSLYESIPFDFRYSYKGSAMTAHKPVYLVSTYDTETDTYTPVEDGWITQTLPTAEDNLYYVLLGYAYTASSIYLKPQHPVFKFENGQIKEVRDENLESRIAAVENSDGLKVVGWLGENNAILSKDDTTSVRYIAMVKDGTVDGAYLPTIPWIQDQVTAFAATIPQKTSQLTNDSGFVTQSDMSTAMGQALTQVQTMIDTAIGGVENGSY